ncbi:relaxase/mobilization nuclease domain-containing protein [Roseibium aggregatum]|uniref:relaxase/mobilization nuclease domain-containing protein n=1 Tax=Roseibium aggregatum TaxID=187304 RepID=UPI001E4A7111|nr:hypothetical protein [Roseibium aggregatum]UES49920.1 hypothetical protein GFK88_10015 [Roseibium aggregatum]
MIAGVTRHARTQRDSRALATHLLKPENNPRTRILGGSLATDLSGALADMQRLRDSTKADSAAFHIHLSPSRAMSDEELGRAADIVIRHFGGEGHPAALVTHEKERRDGDGHRHAHLVLGRVSPEGRVLEAGFEKIRLETAARIIEHELGEEPTLGRHHTSAVRWLRNNGRSDIADWLTSAHGPNPDKPTSTASPDKRQALARQGVNLADARAEIRDAWTSGGAEAVREAGYAIESGRKSGIFIVSRDGTEIGSLDRLTGEKRADVRNAMEPHLDQISRKERKSEPTQRAGGPVQRDSGPVAGDPSSEESEKFRPERFGFGARHALRGKKKSGAEQVSEAAAEQGRRLAESFERHQDAALAVAAAHRWIKDRRAELKGAILESSRMPDDADARRDVARSCRELAVLDAAEEALWADPSLAIGGERALMGAARRLHAGRMAAKTDGEDIEYVRLTSAATPPDAESPLKSPQARTSANTQPSRKPAESVSAPVVGDPSAGKRRSRRSPEEAAAAAGRFLDRVEADLRGRITQLSRPDKLSEPTELTDARQRLTGVAQERAAWDVRHGARLTELRLKTAAGRPVGFWAWVSGATGRYDVASRELNALSDEREPLRLAKAEATQALRILQSAQETRQVVHDEDRMHRLQQLRHQEELLQDARAALKDDPMIACAGRKGLAKAAKERQTARLLAQSKADERGYDGGNYAL